MAANAATSAFLDSYLPYVLRQVDQTLSAGFYRALNDHGVQRSEWRVIAVLHECDSMSIRDLTETALSPQPTVTHAVSRLEARGLATRLQGTEDKRHRFVSLTDAGRSLAVSLIAEARALEAEALQLADAGDLGPLIENLRTLHAKLDRSQENRHV